MMITTIGNSIERILKGVFIILLASLFVFTFAADAHADMGAKPSITLTVVNGPKSYYVALLTDVRDKQGDNSELKLENVDSDSVRAYLEDFQYDGWDFFQSPVGSNIFEYHSENEFYFGYMVPDRVRVILISSDGTVYISDELDVEDFDSQITYDVQAGTLTEKLDEYKGVRGVLYVILCFVLTLVFEFLILKLFRYPLTRWNVICFNIINMLTNIPLNAVNYFLGMKADLPLLVIWFFLEILIIFIEGIFYIFTLKDKEGHRRKFKNFAYGVIANVFSAVMGFAILIAFSMIVDTIKNM